MVFGFAAAMLAGLRAGSPGGSSARVRSLGRARCGVSRRRRLLAPVGGSLRNLPRRLLAGPHAPRVAERPIPKEPANRPQNNGRPHCQRCPAQRYRKVATEPKTFMLRSPPPSLVPDPDLSWGRNREPPTEVADCTVCATSVRVPRQTGMGDLPKGGCPAHRSDRRERP